MTLILDQRLLEGIQAHGQASYPNEGAGLLLGHSSPDGRRVLELKPLPNHFEPDQQNRRYRLDPLDIMRAEDDADARGLEIIGIFHSHPDHPAQPSQYDLEWSLPFFSYIITSIEHGTATESRSWRLADSPRRFEEETIQIDTLHVEK